MSTAYNALAIAFLEITIAKTRSCKGAQTKRRRQGVSDAVKWMKKLNNDLELIPPVIRQEASGFLRLILSEYPEEEPNAELIMCARAHDFFSHLLEEVAAINPPSPEE